MSSRVQLVLLLLGVLCMCQAKTPEETTEEPKKEPTTSEGVVITGVVLVTSFVVLIVLLPTIALDKMKKRREAEIVPVQ